MNELILNFSGPFTLTDGKNSVFRSRHAKSAGIYLWTIRQKSDNVHLIHYVGETTRLGSRHREHLTQILGLNYGIFAPEKAQRGVCEPMWAGLWRDKTEDGPGKALTEYKRINEHVLKYVEIITIFFAEIIVEDKIRRHIEGCIGWDLRSNHPESKQLYPDDNQVGPMYERSHGHLLINVPEVIQGLDDCISY